MKLDTIKQIFPALVKKFPDVPLHIFEGRDPHIDSFMVEREVLDEIINYSEYLAFMLEHPLAPRKWN
ncbi:MAG: hypothetical protein Q7R95_09750, partial [bacterium]|nr:hypothetical protein [bacterium]